MVKVVNFDKNFEQSLTKLGEHIETQKNYFEREKKDVSEKEIIKHSIQSFSNEAVSREETALPQTPVPSSTNLPSYLADDKAGDEARIRVQNLINLVFSKGLESALKEASKHPPFIEDAFHDALVDKLVPELKKRGIIK